MQLDEKYIGEIRRACDKLDAEGIRPPQVLFNEEPNLRNEEFRAGSFNELLEITRHHPFAASSVGRMITEIAKLDGIGRDIYELFLQEKYNVMVDREGYLARHVESRHKIGLNYNRYTMENSTGGFDLTGLEAHPVNFFAHELGHHLDLGNLHSGSRLFRQIGNVDKRLRGERGLFYHIEELTSRFYKSYHSDSNRLEPFANMMETFSGHFNSYEGPSVLEGYRDTILATEVQIRTQLKGAKMDEARAYLGTCVEKDLPDIIGRRLDELDQLRGAAGPDRQTMAKLVNRRISAAEHEVSDLCEGYMKGIAADVRQRFDLTGFAAEYAKPGHTGQYSLSH